MESKTLAIVVPSHNRKKFLLEALNSILSQDALRSWTFHVVVVDDGSTDDTFKSLCRRFNVPVGNYFNTADLTPQLSIIKQRNGERGNARNSGAKWAIRHFQPEWILFFDSDDILVPDALRSLERRTGKNPAEDLVAVYGGIQIWNGIDPLRPVPSRIPSPEGDLSPLILDHTILPLGATLVRAEKFRELGGFSENRRMSGSEDWLFLTRLALTGKVYYTPKIITGYRQHRGNTASTRFMTSIDLSLAALVPDIIEHYREDADHALRRLRRQAEFKKVGALNSRGHTSRATEVLTNMIREDKVALIDYRAYRLSLSILKATIFRSDEDSPTIPQKNRPPL